jgi:AcrR family transcriptional regulator
MLLTAIVGAVYPPAMAAAAFSAPSLTGRRLSGEQLADLQRAKILRAAVHVVGERGYSDVTVAQIISAARISRGAFYALFADREECLAAILHDAAERIERELSAASVGELPWAERVRAGLLAILELLDREPALARVCVIEAPRGGPAVRARRTAILRRLAAVLEEAQIEHPCGSHCTSITADALVGAAFTVVHSRILAGEGPLAGSLAADLTRMLLLPYIGDPVTDREQARIARSPRLARGLPPRRPASSL